MGRDTTAASSAEESQLDKQLGKQLGFEEEKGAASAAVDTSLQSPGVEEIWGLQRGILGVYIYGTTIGLQRGILTLNPKP